MPQNYYCKNCTISLLEEFKDFRYLSRVTSDSKTFKKGWRIFYCKNCGLIQKISDQKWLKEISNIYNNYKTFSEACELTLKHYYENKDDIDTHKNGACYIEQLILHSYLRMLDKRYRQSNKNDNHVIFNEQPLREINDKGEGFGSLSIINQKHSDLI